MTFKQACSKAAQLSIKLGTAFVFFEDLDLPVYTVATESDLDDWYAGSSPIVSFVDGLRCE